MRNSETLHQTPAHIWLQLFIVHVDLIILTFYVNQFIPLHNYQDTVKLADTTWDVLPEMFMKHWSFSEIAVLQNTSKRLFLISKNCIFKKSFFQEDESHVFLRV